MNTDHTKDIDLIEAYLAEGLTPEGIKVVESRLTSDAAFIKLFETIRALPEATRRAHLQSQWERLKDLELRLDKDNNLDMHGANISSNGVTRKDADGRSDKDGD